MQVIDTKEREGIRLWCRACGNVWLYRGRSSVYTCCSNCHCGIAIRKRRVGDNVALTKARQQINGNMEMKNLLQSDPRGGTHNQTVTTETNGDSNG
jgi:hypothetical protein